MRVLVMCDWFLKYASGQLGGLRDCGATTALLCRTHAFEFGGDPDERASLVERVRRGGTDVFELAGRMSSLAGARDLARLREAVARWKPDVVHVHDNHDPRLLAASGGHRTVLTIHDPTPHVGAEDLHGLRRLVRERWIARAARVVIHSELLRGALSSPVRQKAFVIPHGAQVRESPLPIPPRPTILFHGRLELYKGLDVLLTAMGDIWRAQPDVQLVVAGQGPAASGLAAVDDPRIVKRLEYIPESEVPSLLEAATVTVLPYVEASQSGVGALSLAAGVPVVVTDVGGLRDLAVAASYIAHPGDATDLARCILDALKQDAATREGTLGMARARFAWDVVGRSALQLYESVAHR
jgi:glycosyltransferase involved in cell wall biosynthesis